MQIKVIKAYKKFECIASGCEDSCCDGWRIDIDENSATLYKKHTGELKEMIEQYLLKDKKGYHFHLKDGHCPFLNKEKLCDIYRCMGKESLSQICTSFPRKMNIYGNSMDVFLNMSCPRAAELMLSGDGLEIEEYEDDIINPDAGQDETAVKEIKELFMKIAKTANFSTKRKLVMMMYIADTIKREKEDALNIIESYLREGFEELDNSLPPDENIKNEKIRNTVINELSEMYAYICEKRQYKSLPGKKAAKNISEQEVYGRYFTYYLLRHMNHADYDKIYEKTVMLCVSYMMIKELTETNSDIVRCIQRYCKIFEHSKKDYGMLKEMIYENGFDRFEIVIVSL